MWAWGESNHLPCAYKTHALPMSYRPVAYLLHTQDNLATVRAMPAYRQVGARSSVVERFLDMEEVDGSIPFARTRVRPPVRRAVAVVATDPSRAHRSFMFIANLSPRILAEDSIMLSRKERLRRENIVITMYPKTTRKEVATALELSENSAHECISRLMKEGKLARKNKGDHAKNATWKDLSHPRTAAIVRMLQVNMSYGQIAAALPQRPSRARIGQLVIKIRAFHDDQICKPAIAYFSPEEVAVQLDISGDLVRSLCKNNKIPHIRAGGSKNARYLIPEHAVVAIQEHPLVTKKRVCTVCKQEFIVKHNHCKSINTCDRISCQKIAEFQRHEAYWHPKQPIPLELLTGWRAHLAKKLAQRIRPKRTVWLCPHEACIASSLSTIQLYLLKCHGIVRTQPHPTKTWRREPVQMYEKGEMLIVKKVYQQHLKR